MWRDTGRPVKLVFLDARACLPLLVFVVYWSWPTFYIAATGVIFFSVISWAGLTVPSTLRMIRRGLVGPGPAQRARGASARAVLRKPALRESDLHRIDGAYRAGAACGPRLFPGAGGRVRGDLHPERQRRVPARR